LAFATFPTKFEALRLLRPEAFPVYKRAATVTKLDPSWTFRLVRVPTVVMFVWVLASWRDVRAPVRLDEFRFEIPEALPM
jgi:hypothetical protein